MFHERLLTHSVASSLIAIMIASSTGFPSIALAQFNNPLNATHAMNTTTESTSKSATINPPGQQNQTAATFTGKNLTANNTTVQSLSSTEGNFLQYKGSSKISGAGNTIIEPAESFTINWTKEAPKLTPGVIRELNNRTSEADSVQPPILSSNETIQPPKAGTETKGQEEGAASNQTITKPVFYQPIYEGTFTLFRDDFNIRTTENH
jgi:hypothetical protein